MFFLDGAMGTHLHWSFVNKEHRLLRVRASVTHMGPDESGKQKSWGRCIILMRGMMDKLRWGCTTQIKISEPGIVKTGPAEITQKGLG